MNLVPIPFALTHIKGEIILANFHEKPCLSRQLSPESFVLT